MSKKSKRAIRHESLETAPPAKKKQSGKATWKMMDKAATLAAGVVAQRVSSLAWRAATGKKPPTANTRNPELGTTEAVSWAVLAGVAVELSKILFRRGTATYWVKSTGNLPPGMKPLKTADTKGKEKPADPPVEESAGTTAKRRRRISSRSRGK